METKTYYDNASHDCLETVCPYNTQGICIIDGDDYMECPFESPAMAERIVPEYPASED